MPSGDAGYYDHNHNLRRLDLKKIEAVEESSEGGSNLEQMLTSFEEHPGRECTQVESGGGGR